MACRTGSSTTSAARVSTSRAPTTPPAPTLCADALPAAKVHLLQSVVSAVLVDMVFDAYYVGLSDDETRLFRHMEELLRAFAASDEAINQWRVSTLALLREAPQLLHAETGALVDAVVAHTMRILDAVTAPPSAEPSAAAPLRPDARAVDLARLLAVQKAVLRVLPPPARRGLRFDAAAMEHIGGEDDDLAARHVCCVVFPGLVKHGDESGGQLQLRNVIAKARVLCSPPE